jgi:hypothetical protein
MNTKKVMSIVVLVTAAAIFALSSIVVTPVVAQSYGGGGGGGNDGASDSENYKEFQKCLSDAKTNGVVTEQQIRDCFSPIYTTSGGSDDTNYGNNDYDGGGSSSISSDTNYGNNDGDGYNDDMEENEQK